MKKPGKYIKFQSEAIPNQIKIKRRWDRESSSSKIFIYLFLVFAINSLRENDITFHFEPRQVHSISCLDFTTIPQLPWLLYFTITTMYKCTYHISWLIWEVASPIIVKLWLIKIRLIWLFEFVWFRKKNWVWSQSFCLKFKFRQ